MPSKLSLVVDCYFHQKRDIILYLFRGEMKSYSGLSLIQKVLCAAGNLCEALIIELLWLWFINIFTGNGSMSDVIDSQSRSRPRKCVTLPKFKWIFDDGKVGEGRMVELFVRIIYKLIRFFVARICGAGDHSEPQMTETAASANRPRNKMTQN